MSDDDKVVEFSGFQPDPKSDPTGALTAARKLLRFPKGQCAPQSMFAQTMYGFSLEVFVSVPEDKYDQLKAGYQEEQTHWKDAAVPGFLVYLVHRLEGRKDSGALLKTINAFSAIMLCHCLFFEQEEYFYSIDVQDDFACMRSYHKSEKDGSAVVIEVRLTY